MTIQNIVTVSTDLSGFVNTQEASKFVDDFGLIFTSFIGHLGCRFQFSGKSLSREASSNLKLLRAYARVSENSNQSSVCDLIPINSFEGDLYAKNAAKVYIASLANYKKTNATNKCKCLFRTTMIFIISFCFMAKDATAGQLDTIDAVSLFGGISLANLNIEFNGNVAEEIQVGGYVTGEIESFGDEDWHAVSLVAGETYVIDLKGADGDWGTLADPVLWFVYDASGAAVGYTADNDSGTGRNSSLEFIPEASGTYYINAKGHLDSIGTYTLSVEGPASINDLELASKASVLSANENYSIGYEVDGSARKLFFDQSLVFVGEESDRTTISMTDGSMSAPIQDLSFTHVEFVSQNYDHGITIGDVILQLRDIVGLTSLSNIQKIAADITGDGEVAISDVILNLRHIVGLDTIEQCALLDNSQSVSSASTNSTALELTLIQSGDVDLSATFFELM